MTFEIAAAVRRCRRVVHRSAIRNHHEDAPLLGPGNQSIMRPEQGLAVDILLEQPLAHHEAEVSSRVPVRFVRALVDNVPEVIQPAGIWRPSRTEPGFTALPALPP